MYLVEMSAIKLLEIQYQLLYIHYQPFNSNIAQ